MTAISVKFTLNITHSWSPLGNFIEGQEHPGDVFRILYILYAFYLCIHCNLFSHHVDCFICIDVLLHSLLFNFGSMYVVKCLSSVFLCLFSNSFVSRRILALDTWLSRSSLVFRLILCLYSLVLNFS